MALLAIVLHMLASATLRAQTPQTQVLIVRVIDSLSRAPLPNADITDLATGQHRITDDHGRTSLSWPSDGKMRLRVREIGYQPRHATLERVAVSGEISFAMEKVSYVLPDVRATGRCSTETDTVLLGLSVVALDQLKQAAEKLNEFRRVYPFEATVERRSAAIPPRGDVKRIVVGKEQLRSEELVSRYRPGDVVERRFGGFSVPILNISTLADSVFWEHHCFRARGFGWYQGDRVVRLEFSPTNDVDGPDYMGSAVMDSATSMLLRVDFQLANAHRGDKPTRLDGYTTFMSPSPFVVLPDSTVAVWWTRNPEKGEWGKPDYAQSLHIETMKYKKELPPTYGEGNLR